MPVPLFAAGAVAAVVGATQDCGAPVDDAVDDTQKGEPSSSSMMRAMTRRCIAPSSTDPAKGAVHLSTRQGLLSTCMASGFVDGDFRSGKVHDLVVVPNNETCHVMAFSSGNLLAVGLSQSLVFYETSSYSIVHSTSQAGMVSALCWVSSPKTWSSSSSSNSELLAVGGLDGTVSLYCVDSDILEVQGPSCLYQFRAKGEIRALDCSCWESSSSTLIMVVGDMEGSITMVTFATTIHGIYPLQTEHLIRQLPTGILGVSLFAKSNSGRLAWSTEGGDVSVHAIECHDDVFLVAKSALWTTQRNGPVRCVVFLENSPLLAFGGYDKRVVLVDTELWALSHELVMHGTVNTIEFDPRGRYLGVGCRDKSFTILDSYTYVPIKIFHTTGWVTSISWLGALSSREDRDIVAVRSHNNCISILDLRPIKSDSGSLSSARGIAKDLSWSMDSTYLARTVGKAVIVADSCQGFLDIATVELSANAIKLSFSPADHSLAVIDENGDLSVFLLLWSGKSWALSPKTTTHVAPQLKSVCWSSDGTMIAAGGKGKLLHIYQADSLRPVVDPIECEGRIWDIKAPPLNMVTDQPTTFALALGNYTTVLLDDSFTPILEIARSRTCRCLAFHPKMPILVTGDGADTVCVTDVTAGEIIFEFDAGGRVNTLSYSPAGDFLAVGTDGACFRMYEATTYHCVQEISCQGVALVASFPLDGSYLAIGSESESYSLVQLGPFLGTDMIPLTLDGSVGSIPEWALNEALYRSGDGPSFLQRHMLQGDRDNLLRVAAILRDHPNAIHAFNRTTNEGCFDTALLLKKPSLLKFVLLALVDGSLFSKGHDSILMTNLPRKGQAILSEIVENHPPEYVVEILSKMSFTKVPFAGAMRNYDVVECGSSSFTNPWENIGRTSSRRCSHGPRSGERTLVVRTPAVLPLPGLGDLKFLSSLLSTETADVFDNVPMALVLRTLWNDHIRRFFYFDFFLFTIYYVSWVTLVEQVSSVLPSAEIERSRDERGLALALLLLNTLFAGKEVVQSSFGRLGAYWRSIWNLFDILSITGVYFYAVGVFLGVSFIEGSHVPLSVATTVFLTLKLLSYLRGFSKTGWLIAVLIANFSDVRGFLVIMFIILVGFSVSFRAVFAQTDEFDSLRRSFLSTFEMTVTGAYNSDLLFESDYTAVAVVLFILAITCVLVVALNALISILADSYARVQENSVANRRREQAALVIEYMTLLPTWKREQIATETEWFHTLLEVDDDGFLVESADWMGGLNALRRDMEKLVEANSESHERALAALKDDIDGEIQALSREVMSVLGSLVNDVKHLRKSQAELGITFSGKNVKKAVMAVKSAGRKGSALFRPGEG